LPGYVHVVNSPIANNILVYPTQENQGRPITKKVPLGFREDSRDLERLRAYMDEHGLTIQEVIRVAVADWLEKHGKETTHE
jgi:hypothetical protein